ncbi:uncharacterized protein VTP21DRAFT_2593 [Calcarisporiella thermophila]|uniref:uncharacterized protein n=1 Tax=Calcarisporiella thermophila TaxID=911321 RepID=UPI003742993D
MIQNFFRFAFVALLFVWGSFQVNAAQIQRRPGDRKPSSKPTSSQVSDLVQAAKEDAKAFRSMEPFSNEHMEKLKAFYDKYASLHNESVSNNDALSSSRHCPVPIPPVTCNPKPGELDDGISDKDRDVRRLRPQDIGAVLSFGDSITAGFAMSSGHIPFVQILEERGKVFSIGGDSGQLTLPNILRLYNPKLTGMSTDVTLPLATGNELNSAISGATSKILNKEIDRAVSLLNGKYRAIKNQWKMITLLIGPNDVCGIISNTNPIEYGKNVRAAVERIRTDIGKAFVNLVGVLDVTQVHSAAQSDLYCAIYMNTFPIECPNAVPSKAPATRQRIAEYNAQLAQIADDYQAKNYSDFYVSVQPAFEKAVFDKYGQGFLSGLDCFHPNVCANKAFAVGLWKNLFEPKGKKSTLYPENATIYCPKKGEYFQ